MLNHVYLRLDLLVPGVGWRIIRALGVWTTGAYYFYLLCLHDLCLASSLQRLIGMALSEQDTPHPHICINTGFMLAIEPRS